MAIAIGLRGFHHFNGKAGIITHVSAGGNYVNWKPFSPSKVGRQPNRGEISGIPPERLEKL